MKKQHGLTAQGGALPKFGQPAMLTCSPKRGHKVESHLIDTTQHGRIHLVAAKSATGCGSPCNMKATLTPIASFFVSVPSVTISSDQGRPVSMVALVGQPKGWPVSFVSGSTTPINVTAICERGSSGGDSLNTKEAAHMVATPTPSHPEFTSRSRLNPGPMTFTLAVAPRLARLAALSRCRIVHVTAHTESQARASLAALSATGEAIGLSLVFMSRVQSRQEVAA